MSRAMIATVVEGQGEVAAVPVLLHRMAAEIAPEVSLELPRPYRVGRGALFLPHSTCRWPGRTRLRQVVAGCGTVTDGGGDVTVRVGTEEAFEVEIVSSMLAAGWLAGDQTSYRPKFGLDTGQLFAFIGTTQIDTWNTLVAYAGGDADEAQQTPAGQLTVDGFGHLHVRHTPH